MEKSQSLERGTTPLNLDHSRVQLSRGSSDSKFVATPLEFEVIAAVLRLAQNLRLQLTESLTGHGMTWARYEILAALTRRGPSSYQSLARQLERHRTSIATTVTGLEKAGYVSRSLTSPHGQQWIVSVTGHGELATERAERALRRTRLAAETTRAEMLEVLRQPT